MTVSTRCSSVLGPAIAPSFVTCAVITRTLSRSFTQLTSSFAQYLSWFTVPGTIPASAEYTVWIESIIVKTGLRESSASRISSRRIVQRTSIPCEERCRRSARSFICAADSSPETYRMRCEEPLFFTENARLAAVCTRSVDFPIPGSPPIKIAERFSAPPPRTRSNSSMPVRIREVSFASTEESGTGFTFTETSEPRPAGLTAFESTIHSSKEFHSPHSGHLPSQRGCEYPHPEHL